MAETTTTEQPAPPPGPALSAQPPLSRSRGIWLGVLTTLLSMLMAMLVGAILIIATDTYVRRSIGYFFDRPSDTFYNAWFAVSQAYAWIFKGAIFDPATVGDGGSALFSSLSETVVYATPVILTALSVAIAFRAGLFNIGAQGQMIMGACLAAWLGFHYGLPMPLHLLAVPGRGHPGRRDLRRRGRRAQGGDRCARGHRHDHVQLDRPEVPGLPAGHPRVPGARRSTRRSRSTSRAPRSCRSCSSAIFAGAWASCSRSARPCSSGGSSSAPRSGSASRQSAPTRSPRVQQACPPAGPTSSRWPSPEAWPASRAPSRCWVRRAR